MRLNYLNTALIITLSSNEIWFISRLFAPGLIFGVDDPTEGLTEEEIQAVETETYTALTQAGILEIEAPGQVRIDEMLGAMVYSTIHSTDLLALKTPGSHAKHFYHFLPPWQLELCQVDEEFQMTLFKERSDLFPHILGLSKTTLYGGHADMNFTISERDLELAAFLYESGKKDRALAVMTSEQSQQPLMERFIQGYMAPELHLVFDMIYDRNDDIRVRSSRNELLQAGEGLYWLSHDLVGEEVLPIVDIQVITPETAQARFLMMLPIDEA